MLSMLFRSLENPNVPLTGRNLDAAFYGRTRSASGLRVSAGDMLSFSPVWSAIDQITSDIARLPWVTYKGLDVREIAKEHPAYKLLRVRTDAHTTPNVFIVRILCHALLYGNGYAVIDRDGMGHPTALRFVPSWKVTRDRQGGQLYYAVQWNAKEDGRGDNQVIESARMFHLQGLTISELGGLSLVDYARDTVGRHLAANGYGDDFFANSAVPDGFFVHPKNMSQPAAERFLANIRKLFGSNGKRHGVGLLEEDIKWVQSGISPKDAMLIDMMKWGVPEVARYFRMPPHRLADPSRQGWNTTEAENRSYLSTTLGGWIDRLQCEARHKLFRDDEQPEYYTEFDTSDMVKPTTLERYQAYGVAIQWGFMTRNEARRQEDLAPLEGLDEPLTPVNMTTDPSGVDMSTPAQEPPQDSPEDDQEDQQQAEDDNARALQIAQRDVLADQLERMTKRVVSAATRAAKEPRSFLQHVNEIDATHRQAVGEALRPAAAMVAALHKRDAVKVLEELTGQFLTEASRALLEASEVQPDKLVQSVSESSVRLSTWGRELASQLVFGGVPCK